VVRDRDSLLSTKLTIWSKGTDNDLPIVIKKYVNSRPEFAQKRKFWPTFAGITNLFTATLFQRFCGIDEHTNA